MRFSSFGSSFCSFLEPEMVISYEKFQLHLLMIQLLDMNHKRLQVRIYQFRVLGTNKNSNQTVVSVTLYFKFIINVEQGVPSTTFPLKEGGQKLILLLTKFAFFL